MKKVNVLSQNQLIIWKIAQLLISICKICSFLDVKFTLKHGFLRVHFILVEILYSSWSMNGNCAKFYSIFSNQTLPLLKVLKSILKWYLSFSFVFYTPDSKIISKILMDQKKKNLSQLLPFSHHSIVMSCDPHKNSNIL